MQKNSQKIKKLMFKIFKSGKTALVVLQLIVFVSCSNSTNEKSKLEIVNNHIENYVLMDIILNYKDQNSKFPNNLEQIIGMYRNGESIFGFNANSIEEYMKDPFSEDFLKYYSFDENSFILYSVGPDGNDDNMDKLMGYKNLSEIKRLFNEYNDTKVTGDLLIYFYRNE